MAIAIIPPQAFEWFSHLAVYSGRGVKYLPHAGWQPAKPIAAIDGWLSSPTRCNGKTTACTMAVGGGPCTKKLSGFGRNSSRCTGKSLRFLG